MPNMRIAYSARHSPNVPQLTPVQMAPRQARWITTNSTIIGQLAGSMRRWLRGLSIRQVRSFRAVKLILGAGGAAAGGLRTNGAYEAPCSRVSRKRTSGLRSRVIDRLT